MMSVIHTFLGERPMRRIVPYIYVVLIAGLFFHPHFSTHIGPRLRPYVEGFTNLFIVGLGILTYYIYSREQREFERRFLETSTYIGAMNRKLPLLQGITTDLLKRSPTTAKQKAGIFQELVGIACGTVAKSDQGLMRFVEVRSGRTVKEFTFSLDDKKAKVFTIGNNELLQHDSLPQRDLLASPHLVVAASDRAAAIRAFLVIPNPRKEMHEHIPILRAIVDQGQIFSGYVFGNFSKRYA